MNVTDRLSGNRCDSWIGALAVLLLGVFVFPTLAFSQNTIILPIEVYPDDGRSSHVESVTINASNGSAANRVFFQMHQPFYHRGGWETSVGNGFDPETMVDVRLNGGTWTTVTDANVTCATLENNYDCVGGAFSTIRFAIRTADIGSIIDGANTLSFRFNGTEGVRSGFRILHIGFMRATDNLDTFEPLPKADATDTVIDGTTFEYWDPGSWTAPAGYEDPSFVSAGEALWSAENSLEDLDGTPIVAACGSCHATDGRDLQYFAFSNETIIARSRSHGLTEDEGKKIAAYIRSLQFTYADGTTPATTNSPGTPWDPPYQPGPTGFGPNKDQHPDGADSFYWAAGAGLEWVIDQHEDVTQYAFPASGDPANPNGVKTLPDGSYPWTRYKIVDESEWGDNGGTNRGTAINMREIPVSVQFPDWNNWLPDVHPHDGMEKLFDGSNSEALFDNGPSVFQSGNLSSIESWLNSANGDIQSDIKRHIKNSNNPTDGTNNNLTGPQWEAAINSVMQWRAVKIWYLQHKYHVEDKADELYCDGSEAEWCEPRGWLGTVRAVFDMGPHVSGVGHDEPYAYGIGRLNDFYSHVWYQVQMVVNPGTPGSSGQNPTDEGYQEMYLGAACNGYDVACGVRQMISEWKFFQIMSNDINGRNGMIPGNVTLDKVFDALKTGDRKSKYWDRLTETSEGAEQAERWTEAFIRAINTYMVGENGSEGRISTLERLPGSGYDSGGFVWNGIEYDPNTNPNDKDYASYIYAAMSGSLYEQDAPMAQFYPNMSRGALDSLAAQGDLLSPDDRDDGYAGEVTNGWSTPGPRWHDLVDYTPPSTGSQTIGLGQGWNLISSRINPSDPAIESVFGGVDSDLSLVKNEAGDIYSPEIGLNDIGDWQSREGYLVYMTNSQSMGVSGYEVDPSTSFMLEEGWNLIPYYPETTMTPADAFASISSELVLVKNQAGETYVPDPQDPIDDIGQLQPGKAYKVYVSSPVSFSYPSN